MTHHRVNGEMLGKITSGDVRLIGRVLQYTGDKLEIETSDST